MLFAHASKSGSTSSGVSIRLGMSSWMSKSLSSYCGGISTCSGYGDRVAGTSLHWVVGEGLLASPPDWVAGVRLLAWVFCGCTGTPSYLAQAACTTQGNQGQQLGDTLDTSSISRASY